ncbi:MAG: hypothetical protein LUH05_03165 [Candidatus Gastranaerophilales bacterium]|nr:hypothetical protein [Candidatus Gastranaerophilales bacterium]
MIQNIKTKLTSNVNTQSTKASKSVLPQKENGKKKLLLTLVMLRIAGVARRNFI